VLNIYTYEKGEATRSDEPLQATPEQTLAALFDVDEVDFDKIPGLVDKAIEATGITEPSELQVSVTRAIVGESPAGPIEIVVSLTDDTAQGMVTTDVNGTVVSMSGGKPGSQAEQFAATL